MGVVIIEQLARQIMPSGDIYMTLVGNDIIESRAIVLAMARRVRSCCRAKKSCWGAA